MHGFHSGKEGQMEAGQCYEMEGTFRSSDSRKDLDDYHLWCNPEAKRTDVILGFRKRETRSRREIISLACGACSGSWWTTMTSSFVQNSGM